jgi:hypothetical protein
LCRRSAKKNEESCRKSLWFRVPDGILNSVEGILNVTSTRKTKNKVAMNTVTNSAATSASATVVAAKLTKSVVPAGRTVVAAKGAKPTPKTATKTAAKTATKTAAKPAAPVKAKPAAKPAKKPTVKPAAPVKANPAKTDTKTDTKAKPVKKNATKGSVGRPKKVIKLIMDKTFSLRDVVNLNPTTNKLTVRKHILDGVKAGVFMKLTSTVSTGKRGKPAHLFVSAHEPTVAQGLNAAVAVAA